MRSQNTLLRLLLLLPPLLLVAALFACLANEGAEE
jgi:hypothetical protein